MTNIRNELEKGEIVLSASPETAEKTVNNEDNKKIFRNLIIKVGIIIVSVIIIIIIGSIAWFTMNRENETNGMSMTGTSLPFDIVTKGTAIRNESVLDEVRTEVVNGTARSVYSSGASGTFTDSSDNNTYTFYQADSLKLRFTPVDDPSTTDINEEENPPDIGPGSSAALSLFVVPNTDSAINVKITMNVVAFAEIQKMENGSLKYKKNDNNEFILDSNGNKIVDTEIVEIKNTADFAQRANAVGNSGIADKAADYVKAAAYLGNHILFFGGAASDPETSGYYFTDPITTGTVTRSIPANNKGKAVAVPIYWMWTNTFGQIALTGSVDGLRTGIPILADTNTTDKAKITTYLIENKENIFYNFGPATEGYITAVTTPTSDPSLFRTAFNNLSSGYNQADNTIGTKILYFMIELNIEEG